MAELAKIKPPKLELVKTEVEDIKTGAKGFVIEKSVETLISFVPGGKYLVLAYEAAKYLGPAIRKAVEPIQPLADIYAKIKTPVETEWIARKLGGDDYKDNKRSVVDELKETREALEKGFKRTVVEVSLTAVVNDRRNSVEGKKAGKYRYQAACFAWLYKGCVVSWQWVNWEKAVFVSPSPLVTEFEVMPFNGVEGSWRAYVVPEDKKVPAKTGTFGK
jgi:hypothetical protein